MAVAATRTLATSGGRSYTIHRTSLFEGAARGIEVTFLQGGDWSARIVFDGCAPEVVDDALARLRWSAAPEPPILPPRPR